MQLVHGQMCASTKSPTTYETVMAKLLSHRLCRPYHHGKKRLRQMDPHKWRALHHVLDRTRHDIEVDLDSVRGVEKTARSCYEGQIPLSSNEFVEMMVLDGCFVLELMRGAAEGFTNIGYPRNNPVFSMRGSMYSIQRDMIMLENQLPLFILDLLLGIQFNNPERTGHVAKLAVRFFYPLTPTDEPLPEGNLPPDLGSLHCLDVFRRSLLQTDLKPDEPVPISDSNQLESSLGQATTFDPPPDLGSLHCLKISTRSLSQIVPKLVSVTGKHQSESSLGQATTSDSPRDLGSLQCVKAFGRSLLQLRYRNRLESSLGQATTSDSPPDLGSLHCLEAFRRILLGIETTRDRGLGMNECSAKRRQRLILCATELREAGIKFKKRKTDRIWDIKFKNGVLRIPRLLIHDGTRSLLLNLIAFEQCHFDCSNDITAYAIFMDNLINSSEDVAYLHRCGIIEHWLGSDDEVAELFNRLCQEVIFDINDNYLHQLSDDVKRYCSHKRHAWKATLRHKYFINPWAIISFVAAVVLLLLTFGQTFYSVYAYYRPRH